jgi:hypothetical protein
LHVIFFVLNTNRANGTQNAVEDYKLNSESRYLSFAPLSVKKGNLVETAMKPNTPDVPPMPQEPQEKYVSYKDSACGNLDIRICDNKDLSPINFVHDYKVETVHRKGRHAKNRAGPQKESQTKHERKKSRDRSTKGDATPKLPGQGFKHSETSLIHLRSKSNNNLAASQGSRKNLDLHRRSPSNSGLETLASGPGYFSTKNFSLGPAGQNFSQSQKPISDVYQTATSNFDYFNGERNLASRENIRTLFPKNPQPGNPAPRNPLSQDPPFNGEDSRNFVLVGNTKIYYQCNNSVISDIIDHDLRKNLRV